MKSKSQIRILHYIGSLNIGGSQTMIMELYRHIDKSKIQFDFIVDRKEDLFYKEEIENLGGKVYIFENFKGYNYIKYIKQLKTFFKEHPEYKIIHGHVRSVASIYLKIAKKYGLVTISHSHSTSNGNGVASLVKKILQYKIRYIADYFIGCSKISAVWLFGKKIANSNRCFILNNAIDTKKFCFNEKIREKIRKEYNWDNKLVICQVGRFVDVKNHEFTLELFEKYFKTNSNALLLLIGNGPLEEKIKNKIKKLNIESNVIILKNRNDIYDLLQSADIFLMPSLYEGLPLTLVEAQASSLPCVISNKISAGFLIDELINKVDLNSSYDEWINVINKNKNNIRKNRQKEIIESGFDIEKNVEWLEKFYLNILDK